MSHILLVPVVSFDRWAWMNRLARRLGGMFHASVDTRREVLATAECEHPTRRQYNSRCLLQRLADVGPEATWVLGLTSVDLFVPVMTFVIGEALLGGSAAIVSTYRLSDEAYGLPVDEELVQERLEKEALHELGHCHGLVHCVNWNCVMHASSSAEAVDLKSHRFCALCDEQIRLRATPT